MKKPVKAIDINKYRFNKYDPRYPEFFAAEKVKLRKFLGQSIQIEHIGSTAVPGLGGKGILDILIGVPGNKILETKQLLEENNYLFSEKASKENRLFLKIDYPYQEVFRRVHLHLVNIDSAEWYEPLYFRDYLLKHPEAVATYADLKKEGVKKAKREAEIYKAHKKDFIDKIVANQLKNLHS